MAERTGLEPATPGVTGRYSNQLNYRSIDDNIGDNIDENKNDNLLPVQDWWVLQGSNLRPTACKAVALPTELNTPIRQKPCPMEHFATNNLLRVCLQIALGEKRANCTDWRLAVKEVAPRKPPSVKNSLQKPPLGTKPLCERKPFAKPLSGPPPASKVTHHAVLFRASPETPERAISMTLFGGIARRNASSFSEVPVSCTR